MEGFRMMGDGKRKEEGARNVLAEREGITQ